MRIKKSLRTIRRGAFPHTKPQILLYSNQSPPKYIPFLSVVLLSTALLSPAQGMMNSTGSQSADLEWSDFFDEDEPCLRGKFAKRTFAYLDTRSLGRAAQVNKKWQGLVRQTLDEPYAHLEEEKELLTTAILDAINAEPNEVERGVRVLKSLMESAPFQAQASASLKQKLVKLCPRLLQPENLILANEKDDFLENPVPDHPALAPFIQIITDLDHVAQETQFKDLMEEKAHVFFALKAHYEHYLESLLARKAKRAALLRPKAILSGEGLMDADPCGNPLERVHSYRISQEMAFKLLSKDRYGLFLKKNSLGSHGVSRQGDVHFKGNTTSTGLPVGMEAASYWLMKVIFGEGMAPSALLTLNEVEIKTPPERTPARSDHSLALALGKTSHEFWAEHLQHQHAFTEKDPHHVLQAGLHVEGLSLEDFMRGVEAKEYTYDDLDLNSFSQHIIMSLLTNPSDGTPGNFMVRRSGNNFSIVGIDNDMAFGPPIIAAKSGKNSYKPSLEVKNVLYCLPLMQKPLSQDVRDKILRACPDLIFLRWLDQLQKQVLSYDQLKNNGYTQENSHIPYLTEELSTHSLQLPLQLPATFKATFFDTLEKIQTKIRSRASLTHDQLLSYLQPLVHRFYDTLRAQYFSPLDSYQSIHNSHHEEIYLEDVLAPHAQERLTPQQTIAQALSQIHPQNHNEKENLFDIAKAFWKDLDLNERDHFKTFVELAATSFKSCFEDKTKVHPSWLQDHLLYRALEERVSLQGITFLINTLNLNPSLRHATQQSLFHVAVRHNASRDVLNLLSASLNPEDRLPTLNALDHKGLSPLDYGMNQGNIESFLALRQLGAHTCNASLALAFYTQKVKDDPRFHTAFQDLMDLNGEVEWRVSLEEILPEHLSQKGYRGQIITSSTYGERQLSEEIKKQILNTKGQFISIPTAGNHPIAYAKATSPLKTHGLYFKAYPALPGLEEAVGRLTRQLLGFGAPYTDLINLNNIPVLISQEIPGDTLLKVLKTNPDLLQNLDDEDLSGMLILAMLTNPEDGKPDNYIVSPHPTKSGKYRIIGIDNDQAFVPAIVKETPTKSWTGKILPIAQVKTILYCLNQMNDAIHPQIRNAIINTHPDQCLEAWLQKLMTVNRQQGALLTPTEQTDAFTLHKCFIGVPFQQGAITHIYEKFVHLRDLITEHPTITHIELLQKIEPRLAKRYHTALLQDIPIEERFKQVDRPFYEIKTTHRQGESHTTVTQSGDILQSMGIPLKESLLDSIRLGKENSPTQALEELEQIKKEKNEETLRSLAARVGDIQILKSLTLETSRVLFLNALAKQQKVLLPQEQSAILEYLEQQKAIRELPLPNFTFLSDTVLQKIKLEHLIKLDLRYCTHPNLTNDSLISLSQTAFSLEELNLGYLTQLKTIGDVRGWDIAGTRDAPLIFKQLRTLSLSNCTNLSKILLHAPKLYYLNIENCSKLNDEILDGVIEGSGKLKKLILEGCPLVKEKELRKKFAFYPMGRNLQGTDSIKKLLKNKGANLKFEAKKIDTSAQGLKIFAKALKINQNLSNLTTLTLGDFVGGNNIGASGAHSLANGNLTNLTTLDLGWNSIGDAGAHSLANGNLTNLTTLNLWRNNIGEVGAHNLANGNLLNLTTLDLGINNIGDAGAQSLANGNLMSLTTLKLWRNSIGAAGAHSLANGNLLNLKMLNLEGNNIGAAGAQGLANGNLLNLTTLGLGWNNIGDAGAHSLANGNLTNLTTLNLWRNNIGEVGAHNLANGNLLNLTTLDLGINNIGDAGAQGLANGNLMSLTTLDLGWNNIGDEAKEALRKRYPHANMAF